MRDHEEFWLDFVRRTGSNMAVEGYAHLEDLIHGDQLDERTLRRLAAALRSISQQAEFKASLMEAKRKRPWEFAA